MKTSFLATAIIVVSLPGCSVGVTLNEGKFRCGQLPADDEPLRQWYEAQPGVRDVSVTREGDTVRVRYSSRGEVKHLVPPLAELGYTGLRGVTWNTSWPSVWSILRNELADAPLGLWLVLGCVVIAFVAAVILRRRYSRPASGAAGPGPAAEQPTK